MTFDSIPPNALQSDKACFAYIRAKFGYICRASDGEYMAKHLGTDWDSFVALETKNYDRRDNERDRECFIGSCRAAHDWESRLRA